MDSSMDTSILIVEDDAHMRSSLDQWLTISGFKTQSAASAGEALRLLAAHGADVVLTDIKIPKVSGLELLKRLKKDYPGLPVVLFTGEGDIPMAVSAMRDGAFDFLTKSPYDPEHLVVVLGKAAEYRRLRLKLQELENQLLDPLRIEARIIGNAPAIVALRNSILELAELPINVIVRGETGTGKEEVAKAFHDFSTRRKGPYVAVNCAAVPLEMLEAELFGYEAGAFTGAAGLRVRKFEFADGGTLLLDEIESMPLAAQAKVLRVIQEKQVERLGSNKSIPIDVRIIAATKSDLRPGEAGEPFRADLYYRLAGMELHIAPLRERADDVLLLFDYFARSMSSRMGREPRMLAEDDFAALMQHDWPGNVRELKTVAERFALNLSSFSLKDMLASGVYPGTKLPERVAAFEKTLIVNALKQSGGVVEAAAEALGIPRRTLSEKISRYGIGRDNLPT
jgi:two-component system, NtrC family, C4-dicarboxylate transport response regulator DctD